MALRDDMTKHRIFVQRLGGTEHKNIMDQLNQLKALAKVHVEKKTNINAVKILLRDKISSLPDITVQNMIDIAEYESEFSAKVFSKYFEEKIAPADRKVLEKALLNTNMALNTVKTHSHDGQQHLVINQNSPRKSLVTTYDQFGRHKADELTQIIKDGQSQGLETSEVVKLIDERVAGLFTAQSKVLATTAINYSTNIAKLQVMEENIAIIKQEQWITDLEPGTCGFCEDNNEEIYDQGDAPECPAHFNCNCEVIPYVE